MKLQEIEKTFEPLKAVALKSAALAATLKTSYTNSCHGGIMEVEFVYILNDEAPTRTVMATFKESMDSDECSQLSSYALMAMNMAIVASNDVWSALIALLNHINNLKINIR